MSDRDAPYEQPRTTGVRFGAQALQLITKPGIPHWEAPSPADHLLYEEVPSLPGTTLVLGGNPGALGAALALRSPASHVLLASPNCIALDMARRTLAANGIGNATVLEGTSVLPEWAGRCGCAVLLAPPDRKLARRWLLEAWHALAPGGALWLAGANDEGVRSIIADAAELFGAAPVRAYRQGCRVSEALRAPSDGLLPEWAGSPGIAPGTWREFVVELRGQRVQICSLAGVFAHDRLDAGTQLLLETVAAPLGLRVLDLGCGAGVIGALAARMGAAHADLADANLLAVASAAETLARNGIANAQTRAADGVPPGPAGTYDAVLSNPPFHVGKAIDYAVARAFVAQTRRALRPGGHFTLVANAFLRYDQLLHANFEHVACIAQTASFRVWQAS